VPVAVLKPVATANANGSTATSGTGVYYIHTDQLDAPRVITRASDNVMVWRWDQADPYGVMQPEENLGGLGSFKYNLRLPGQLYDQETGLHYNYFRDDDPATGRYVQSDPVGLAGGQNTYAYARGNPVKHKDPLGLDVFLCQQPAFGISWNPVDHYWIKTDTVEAGMGGTRGLEPGNQAGDRLGDPVQITDHSGRSKQPLASCKKIDNADENTVSDQLKIGRPLGNWGPTNQCQTFARGVINQNTPALESFNIPSVWGF
jgi:RHS repeat-associated protein